MTTEFGRQRAIEELIGNWDELIAEGCMSHDEMVESLTDQIEENCQGWDMSAEELSPEFCLILSSDGQNISNEWDYDNITDEQWDEWRVIVQDAARIWLGRNK